MDVWQRQLHHAVLTASSAIVCRYAVYPFGTPFYLMRIDRKTWITGQALYIIAATTLYLVFILVATSLVCMTQSFIGDISAILGYSGTGQAIALPALVKTLEMSTPYACMGTIFLLMLLYTLLMVFVMRIFSLWIGQLADVVSVFGFSLYGFLLNPQTLKAIFQLPDELICKIKSVGGTHNAVHALLLF
ncbi:MAG: hypothetical protein RRZ24_10555 [Clostridia bacterium]